MMSSTVLIMHLCGVLFSAQQALAGSWQLKTYVGIPGGGGHTLGGSFTHLTVPSNPPSGGSVTLNQIVEEHVQRALEGEVTSCKTNWLEQWKNEVPLEHKNMTREIVKVSAGGDGKDEVVQEEGELLRLLVDSQSGRARSEITGHKKWHLEYFDEAKLNNGEHWWYVCVDIEYVGQSVAAGLDGRTSWKATAMLNMRTGARAGREVTQSGTPKTSDQILSALGTPTVGDPPSVEEIVAQVVLASKEELKKGLDPAVQQNFELLHLDKVGTLRGRRPLPGEEAEDRQWIWKNGTPMDEKELREALTSTGSAHSADTWRVEYPWMVGKLQVVFNFGDDA